MRSRVPNLPTLEPEMARYLDDQERDGASARADIDRIDARVAASVSDSSITEPSVTIGTVAHGLTNATGGVTVGFLNDVSALDATVNNNFAEIFVSLVAIQATINTNFSELHTAIAQTSTALDAIQTTLNALLAAMRASDQMRS